MNYVGVKKHSSEFRRYNACPDNKIDIRGRSQSALNALSIINRGNWKEAYKDLLAVAQCLCLLPDESQCVKELLGRYYFVLQPVPCGVVSIEDFCHHMERNCHDGETAIVQMDYSGFGPEFYAVVPDEYLSFIGKGNCSGRYKCVGAEYPAKNSVREVWVRREDSTPIRGGEFRGVRIPAINTCRNTDWFHYHLANPAGRHTGDCAVRAIATACKISWCEAMERMAQGTGYLSTDINSIPNIEQTLELEGFQRQTPIVVDGKRLTGKAFCEELSKRYHNGEKIIAYVGLGHIAAVLPFDKGGTTYYKIVDSWDSTDCKVGTFFVKSVKGVTASNVPTSDLENGARIFHPSFGEGVIKEVSRQGWTAVSFISDSREERLIDTKWILAHCRRGN